MGIKTRRRQRQSFLTNTQWGTSQTIVSHQSAALNELLVNARGETLRSFSQPGRNPAKEIVVSILVEHPLILESLEHFLDHGQETVNSRSARPARMCAANLV